jgi:hypothetical protein
MQSFLFTSNQCDDSEPETYLLMADGDSIYDAAIEPNLNGARPLKEEIPPIESMQLFDVDVSQRKIYVVTESPAGANISWFPMNLPSERRIILGADKAKRTSFYCSLFLLIAHTSVCSARHGWYSSACVRYEIGLGDRQAVLDVRTKWQVVRAGHGRQSLGDDSDGRLDLRSHSRPLRWHHVLVGQRLQNHRRWVNPI